MILPSGHLKGSLAATSAIASILAAILGGWLTGHWLWAPVCGFLVLLGVVAGAESLKAKHEKKSVDDPTLAVTLSDNASLGDTLIAGRDISQTRTITNVDQSKTSNLRVMGGFSAILAILAFVGATGGTVYIAQQPERIAVESPQNLVTDGSHGSPEGAVKGFIGNVLLDNVPGACSYLLPDEQSTCNLNYAIQSSQGNLSTIATGDVGVGSAIVNGSLALVPIVGKLCASGSCESASKNGLPIGTSFKTAYEQAMSFNGNGNLIPCEEIDGTWYVSFPTL